MNPLEKYPLVSVIIPVYKVEAFLEKCVCSVLDQTYRNLEIILIDDGSPDNCPAICDRLAKDDSRIVVWHKDNGGVAEARNIGLSNMKGEYLIFVDSDDLLEFDAIQIMMQIAITEHADMVCAQHRSIDEYDEDIYMPSNSELVDVHIMTREEAMRYYASKDWASWNRLIRRAIHKGILFPHYRIHEDEAIKFQLLFRCNIVAYTGKVTYQYRQRKGSITSEDSNTERMDMFYSSRASYCWLEANFPEICPYFISKVWEDSLYNVGVLCRKHENNSKSMIDIIKFAGSHRKEILRGKQVSKTQKFRLFMLLFSDLSKDDCLYIRLYKVIDWIRKEKQRCFQCKNTKHA